MLARVIDAGCTALENRERQSRCTGGTPDAGGSLCLCVCLLLLPTEDLFHSLNTNSVRKSSPCGDQSLIFISKNALSRFSVCVCV